MVVVLSLRGFHQPRNHEVKVPASRPDAAYLSGAKFLLQLLSRRKVTGPSR